MVADCSCINRLNLTGFPTGFHPASLELSSLSAYVEAILILRALYWED